MALVRGGRSGGSVGQGGVWSFVYVDSSSTEARSRGEKIEDVK